MSRPFSWAMKAKSEVPDQPSRFLQPPAAPRGEARIAISAGMAGWMLEQRVSLAFTSYGSGRLIVAGVAPDGRLS